MSVALPKEEDACGCSHNAARSGRLIPVEVALARGLAMAEPVSECETLPLEAAIGRVLAAPAVSAAPLPPFDNSAMDGYALCAAGLSGDGPWRLTVGARIAAGDAGDAPYRRGEAVRIFTGAPTPAWCDSVVMQEHVRRDGDAIWLAERPRTGRNIRRAGEDLASGEAILPKGALIETREAAALAAIGAASVSVRRKIRVALFCSGSELRAPGEPLGPGQIWNSNRFALLAALQAPWVTIHDFGVVADDPAALLAALRRAAASADIVVSTGGVSVGDEDHMPRLFREAGGDVHAMRVAMKPGKPLVLGAIDTALYVGLPGNPVAAFVTWKIIGDQILRKRGGCARIAPVVERVRADFSLERQPGRCEYRQARVSGVGADGERRVRLLEPSFSARIATLARADGLAVLPAAADRIVEAQALEFLPL